MNAPTSSPAAGKSVPLDPDVGAEISKLVEQSIPQLPPHQLRADAERIRSSVARLTANSIDGLEGLTSELQELQKFLRSEDGSRTAARSHRRAADALHRW